MKTKKGRRWYVMDLDCYSREFLIEIIHTLKEEKDQLFAKLYQSNICSECWADIVGLIEKAGDEE